MPLYVYECFTCGHKEEIFLHLEALYQAQICVCGEQLKRIMCPPMLQMDIQGYTCPVTGKWIGSRREHLENLKRTDCRILETGEHEASRRYREAKDRELEDTLAESIAKDVAALPAEKQSALCRELESNPDVEFVRTAP